MSVRKGKKEEEEEDDNIWRLISAATVKKRRALSNMTLWRRDEQLAHNDQELFEILFYVGWHSDTKRFCPSFLLR